MLQPLEGGDRVWSGADLLVHWPLPATFRRTQKTQQRRMVDGLGQVLIKARLPGPSPVPLLPITGQGDEQRRVHAGQFA